MGSATALDDVTSVLMQFNKCLADPSDDGALREKESVLVELGQLYRDQGSVYPVERSRQPSELIRMHI